MLPDTELLRRYAEERSEEAFAELVKRHIDFVYTAALRRAKNVQRAQDITQVVFATLAGQAGALKGRTEIVGWLYTTVRYVGAKIARTEERRQRREMEAQMIEAHSADPHSNTDWRSVQPLVHRDHGPGNGRVKVREGFSRSQHFYRKVTHI